jgi:hypothetical protein
MVSRRTGSGFVLRNEARRFTDIVVQLDGAQAPGDFVAPTRVELDAVDRLEKICKP